VWGWCVEGLVCGVGVGVLDERVGGGSTKVFAGLHTPQSLPSTTQHHRNLQERFVENVGRYIEARELLAVCDKRSGY